MALEILLGASIIIIYFGLLLKFSTSIENSRLLERVAICILILLISDAFHRTPLFGIGKLNPKHLLAHGSPPKVTFWVTLVLLVAILLTLNVKIRLSNRSFSRGVFYLITKNSSLSALILITPLSALWSITPVFTFSRGIVFLALSFVAVYVGSCYQLSEISTFLRWSFAFAMVQSTFIVLAFPSIGLHEKGWQGSFSHPGTLGIFAGLTSLLWLVQLLKQGKQRQLSSLILGLSVSVMLQTHSATGLLLVIQGAVLVLFVELIARQKPKAAFIFTMNLLPFIFVGILGVSYYYYNILALLEKSPNLTGRTEFWQQLFYKVYDRLLLGHGFEGFWLPWIGVANPAANIVNSNGYVPEHSHNGFLDLALSLGLIGLSLYCLALFSCLKRSIIKIYTNQSDAVVPLILLLFILFPNMSGNGLWEVGFFSFLFILLATRLALDTMPFSS